MHHAFLLLPAALAAASIPVYSPRNLVVAPSVEGALSIDGQPLAGARLFLAMDEGTAPACTSAITAETGALGNFAVDSRVRRDTFRPLPLGERRYHMALYLDDDGMCRRIYEEQVTQTSDEGIGPLSAHYALDCNREDGVWSCVRR